MTQTLKIAVICGGPSLERGISLNSARSVADHLSREEIEVIPFYVNQNLDFYQISRAQLYSNTPDDFDFKLAETGKALDANAFITALRDVDLVFPAIHGAFGEDGELQTLLEVHDIPHVGLPSESCRVAFDKFASRNLRAQHGFHSIDCYLLESQHNYEQVIRAFYATADEVYGRRAVVKPSKSGSSIGVFSVNSVEEALTAARRIFDEFGFDRAVIEPFISGREFCVVVMENPDGEPVSLVPVEVETSYEGNQVFDYRKKYLPTNQVAYHCPPRFEDETIEEIQNQAERIFKLHGMRDFVRLDGWINEDGNVLFTDCNPVSGMEQNSFIFISASRMGMTHADTLSYVVRNACKRHGLTFPESKPRSERLPVNVIFGGKTAERQVSLMSGTNVWLKLLNSDKYEPKPHLLDKEGAVWELPYAYCLNHTVEEIYHHCLHAEQEDARIASMRRDVRYRLGLESDIQMATPQKMGFNDLIEGTSFLFLGLHGGEGEDGTIQGRLEKSGVRFNGSGSAASKLCMDKAATAKVVDAIGDEIIKTIPKRAVDLRDYVDADMATFQALWDELTDEFGTQTLLIKPQSDGCSAGVLKLLSPEDLKTYMTLAATGIERIEQNTFKHEENIIEMGAGESTGYLIEAFVETDRIRIEDNTLNHTPKDGWVEFTIGVLGSSATAHYALNPSITVAKGDVLTVEEKFQGGTGVNLTPPPSSIVSEEQIALMREKLEVVAKAIDTANYVRIDFFFNTQTNQILIIEANSLPALTPSTVLFHQSLAEPEQIFPRAFIENLIETAGYGIQSGSGSSGGARKGTQQSNGSKTDFKVA